MDAVDFRTFLERATHHLGSQVALAKALGIDPTRINRLLKGGGGDYAHLNFENCLRLAAILDERPAEVLRSAGHHEQAALLEHVCGPIGGERSLRSSEWQLVQLWRELPTSRQAALLTLLATEGGPAAAVTTVRREFPSHRRRRSSA
jgi:hypothetical protein